MAGKLTSEQARRYWQRIHEATADPLAAVCFPDKSAHVNRFFDRLQREAIRRALGAAGFQPRGAAVLDVGCGRGRWLRFYREQGARATGVDVSAAAVDACRGSGLEATVGDATQLPHDDASFDLVSSVTVLLHLPPADQAQAAAEIERVVRPGGLILLLENTGDDRSSHVWSRPLRDWIRMFPGSRPVWVEGHYYGPLLRALWRVAGGRVPPRLQRALEDVAAVVSVVPERLVLRARRGRASKRAWQHVIVLRRLPLGGRE